MAEILVKIGRGSNYEDGDVICAFSDHRIRTVHVDMLCHPWAAGVNRWGLRPSNHTRRWLELTKQYRFERVSRDWVRRIIIATGESELFGPIPLPSTNEYIHTEEYIRRRLSMAERAPTGGPKFAIFGSPGKEVWYGGITTITLAALDQAWDAITHFTGIREDSSHHYRLWPMGKLDIREHLAVRVSDFSQDMVDAIITPTESHKRDHHVDWMGLLDDLKCTSQQVTDPSFPVGLDVRQRGGRWRHESKMQPVQALSAILRSKSRGGLAITQPGSISSNEDNVKVQGGATCR